MTYYSSVYIFYPDTPPRTLEVKRREDEDEVSAYSNTTLGHQMLAMAQERRLAQWLGEDISDHGLGVDVGDRDDALQTEMTP